MARKYVTPPSRADRYKAVIRLRRGGVTATQIGLALGVSTRTVLTDLAEAVGRGDLPREMYPVSPNRRTKAVDGATARRMYEEENLSVAEVAARFGASQATVRAAILMEGGAMRHWGVTK